MATYLLQDLLDIRVLREDEAGQRVLREKSHVEQAHRAVEQRTKELSEYIQWRIEKEDAIYTSVIRKPIHLRQLEELRTDISALRENELVKQQKIIEAETALEKARTVLADAHAAQQAAARDLRKIEEHRDIWYEEWFKEQNLIIDREMEDLHVHRLEFGDEDEDEAEDADDI